MGKLGSVPVLRIRRLECLFNSVKNEQNEYTLILTEQVDNKKMGFECEFQACKVQ